MIKKIEKFIKNNQKVLVSGTFGLLAVVSLSSVLYLSQRDSVFGIIDAFSGNRLIGSIDLPDRRDIANNTTNNSTGKPNFIVINLDDLDVQTMDQLQKAGKLPNISKLREESFDFTNSYVTRSLCCSSRATLLTGLYAHNHGVWAIIGQEGPDSFADYKIRSKNSIGDRSYAPLYLKKNGYKTVFVGKHHLDEVDTNNDGKVDSFNDWDYWRHVNGYDQRPVSWEVSGTGISNIEQPNVYQTKYIGDQAIDQIKNSGDKPFYMMVAPAAVHVNPNSWFETPIDISLPSSGTPVGFAMYDRDSETIRQQLLTKEYVNGKNDFYYWQRDLLIDQKEIVGAWEKEPWLLVTTDTKEFSDKNREGFPANFDYGTSFDIIGFNTVFLSDFSIRQQIIRGDGKDLTFWDRTKTDKWSKWSYTIDESVLEGTVNYPMVGWAALDFGNGVIRQEVIRGSESDGYIGYFRHKDPATGRFGPWVVDPDWGEERASGKIIGYNLIKVDSVRLKRQMMVQISDGSYKVYESRSHVDFESLAFEVKNNRKIPLISMESQDEGDLFPQTIESSYVLGISNNQNSESQGDNYVVPSSVNTYHMMRAYPEGSWSPILPGQTYSWPSGYPAGSLRAGGKKDHFTALNSSFALPTSDANFNSNHDPQLPKSYYNNSIWPDLNTIEFNNTTQLNYLSRQYLDRQEQMLSIDRMVGEIIEAAPDNTVIIFTSDNGHLNGQHRLGNKLTPQEESLKVPLYLKIPGQEGKVIENLVGNIDIAPTIYDYADLSWDHTDGRSLKTLIEDPSASWRNTLLIEHKTERDLQTGRSVIENNWVWGLPDFIGVRVSSNAPAAVSDSLYVKYYSNIDANQSMATESVSSYERYDLKNDPFQINNIGKPPSDLLDKAINNLRFCKGVSCRNNDTL